MDVTVTFRQVAASLKPVRVADSNGADLSNSSSSRISRPEVSSREALAFLRHGLALRDRLRAVNAFVARVRPAYETVRPLLPTEASVAAFSGGSASVWQASSSSLSSLSSSAALLGVSGPSMNDADRDALDSEVRLFRMHSFFLNECTLLCASENQSCFVVCFFPACMLFQVVTKQPRVSPTYDLFPLLFVPMAVLFA